MRVNARVCIGFFTGTIILSLVAISGFAAVDDSLLANGKAIPTGLVALDKTGDTLRGSFTHQGLVVGFEVVRGMPTPEEVREGDSTAPQYEINIRFFDEMGRTFFIQTGGDSINDKWDVAFWEQGQDEAVDALMAPQLFRAAAGAVSAITVKGFLQPGLEPELQALAGVLPILKQALVIERSEHSDAFDAQAKAGCTDKYKIEIHDKSAFFSGFPARHSGTLFKIIEASGTVTQIWSACNHGTCPGVSPMKLKCSWTSAANRCAMSIAPPNCSTSYGFFNGQHVCNDDTVIQYSRIKLNTVPSTSGGTCSDSSLRTASPNCT